MKFSKQHSLYQSEHTKFIADLKAKNPQIDAGQVAGRALLWDKAPTSLDEQDRLKASRLAQQAYVYQNKG
ncbi:DUF3460 family protein [Massilia sp. S19_KUP03_FR1]|uniref:DUF3460 family protein n=1 Tax=Massilia sp. S19_KUP03_FR1 TaxID=3025503 RepID=UPI002FCD7B34